MFLNYAEMRGPLVAEKAAGLYCGKTTTLNDLKI